MAAGRGGLRRTALVVFGLLIAVLLVVSAIADCVLLRGAGHPHAAVPAAAPASAAVPESRPEVRAVGSNGPAAPASPTGPAFASETRVAAVDAEIQASASDIRAAVAGAAAVMRGLADTEDCGPHPWHCSKAALPGELAAHSPASSPWSPLLLLPVLAAAAVSATERGPPGLFAAVVSGRMLLTRLCIARR
ncbi:hypothetical protein [Nocardia inohanensis]|uniref:hypothetical protein n=1 Tax=Nocardia inohanensis TaxID=209246 RepID=UPI00082DCFC7|nr:hypothetical protein [Nocardia inohanensis]